MSSIATDAVNIPKTSTGPKTEAGLESPLGVRAKSKSSRNAIRTGLYAARDFIRSDEEEEYAQTLIQLMDELTPEGVVEQTFATEIMGATWRLRRCRLVEEAFSLIEDLDFDPMMDERTEKQQKSVDRARAQSHLILRRSLTELRNLQKGLESPLRGESRTILEQLQDQKPAAPKPTPTQSAGLPNLDALMAMADHQLAQRYRESGLGSFCIPTTTADPPPDTSWAPPVTSFCNPPAAPKLTPRNAPCPCGSGAKFKRCCGKNAPAVLNQAA